MAKTRTRKPAGKAPAAIKGLAGFRKASEVFSGSVDKGVANQNAALASRANVVPDLDARLICVEPARNSDKYYILQCLEDPKIPTSKPKRYYAYRRWGRTGTGGTCRLEGPMEQEQAELQLHKVFKSFTGSSWASLKPGQQVSPGKYWLGVRSDIDTRARWHYQSDGSDTAESDKWRAYEAVTSTQMEELYAEHVANKCGSNLTRLRFVTSGCFTYSVDFAKFIQRNVKTGRERRIRREFQRCSQGCKDSDEIHDANYPMLATSAQSDCELPKGKRKFLEEGASVRPVIPTLADMCDLIHRGEIQRLPVPTLQAWLRKHNVTASGKKSDLVARVQALVW